MVLLLAGGFRDKGKEVRVYTLQDGWLNDELSKIGLHPTIIQSKRRFDFGLAQRVAAELRRSGAQVLHSHLLDSNVYGALGARLAGVPHVATDHGDVHLPKRKKFLRTKILIARTLGSVFTGVSQFTCKRLVELGANAQSTQLIYNPVVAATQLSASEKLSLRREMGVPGGAWAWLHVAMLRPVKDQQTLLRGFALARAQTTVSQHLVIVGDGEDRVALESLTSELGLQKSVSYLGIRSDVPKLLSAADGFVLSSVSEALPMTVLEAGMAGLLVVSSQVGGVPEILEHGRNGYLFTPRDVSGLSEILVKAVSHPAESKNLAQVAKQVFENRFSRDVILGHYERLFEALQK